MARIRPRFGEAVGALAYANYRRFAASLLLTSLSAQLLQTAIFWQVYELTGSALLLGLTGLVRALPHMLLSLAGGVIADRLDRVRLVRAGQAANAVVVLMLAGLTLAGVIELWHLYAITLLNSGLTAVTSPARTAMIPSLVPGGNLVNAVALNATIGQSSQIIGPALAGIAIATLDLGPTYAINAVAYLGAMVAIIGIRVPSPRPREVEGPWAAFLEGLRFVRGKPVIGSLLVLDLGESILGSYRALLPIIADNLGVGATGYGLLSGAPGVGAMFGATFILSMGDMRYKGLYTLYGVLAYCAALVVMALSPWFAVSLVAAVLLGATNAVQMIPRNSVILAISPDSLRGRVEAFRSMLAGGGPSLGYTFSGATAALLGVPLALTLGGFACALLVAWVGATRRELRDPALGSMPVEEHAASR